jgi:hypothetical protein
MSGTTNQWAVNISWTPTQSQYGPNVICGYATDSTYLIAFNCYTIVVGVAPPTLSVTQIKSPIGNLIRSQVVQNNGNIQWSLEFDQQIVKSKQSNYIRFYLASNDSLLFKVDASGSDASVNNKTLIFNTPSNYFDQGGSFYILLDYGVASGTLFCNPASVQVDDKSFWTFSFDPFTDNTDAKNDEESLNIGAIVGGVVGCLAVAGAIGGGIFLAFRLKKRKVVPQDMDAILAESPAPTPEPVAPKKKTRMLGGNIQDKNFNLEVKNKQPKEIFNPSTQMQEQLKPEIELKPPSKNKMMGPLIKNKTFNYPLENNVKDMINQTKNNFY